MLISPLLRVLCQLMSVERQVSCYAMALHKVCVSGLHASSMCCSKVIKWGTSANMK